MALHINDLPVEILSNILERVRNSCTLPEVNHFVGLLTCCKYWLEVAQPILWRDIVLTNSTIATFISHVSSETGGLVRSLTLRLTFVEKPWRGSYSEGASHPCPGIQALWHDLHNLAPTIRTITNLNTFSLTVRPDLRNTDCGLFCIREEDVRDLLISLPPTCVNLELDTCGFEIRTGADYSTNVRRHLCPVIADLMPRLQNVRLQLSMICDSIFLAKDTATPQTGSCDEDKIQYVSAPRLRSLVIGFYPCRGPPFYCSSLKTGGERFDRENEASRRVTDAAQGAFSASAFPSVTKLSTFQAMRLSSALEMSNLDYENLNERNILRNETRRMPYLYVRRKNSPVVVDREVVLQCRNSEGGIKEIFGDYQEICHIFEGSAFRTSLSLSRYPAEFASSPTANAAGYQFHDFEKKMEILDCFTEEIGYFKDLRITVGDYKGLSLRGKNVQGIADYSPYVEEGTKKW
ncbi:hypothetical protein MMC29_006208 [Sticta canariensis]|nr:hypothetical protein [Sticta canariensis]